MKDVPEIVNVELASNLADFNYILRFSFNTGHYVGVTIRNLSTLDSLIEDLQAIKEQMEEVR